MLKSGLPVFDCRTALATLTSNDNMATLLGGASVMDRVTADELVPPPPPPEKLPLLPPLHPATTQARLKSTNNANSRFVFILNPPNVKKGTNGIRIVSSYSLLSSYTACHGPENVEPASPPSARRLSPLNSRTSVIAVRSGSNLRKTSGASPSRPKKRVSHS